MRYQTRQETSNMYGKEEGSATPLHDLADELSVRGGDSPGTDVLSEHGIGPRLASDRESTARLFRLYAELRESHPMQVAVTDTKNGLPADIDEDEKGIEQCVEDVGELETNPAAMYLQQRGIYESTMVFVERLVRKQGVESVAQDVQSYMDRKGHTMNGLGVYLREKHTE